MGENLTSHFPFYFIRTFDNAQVFMGILLSFSGPQFCRTWGIRPNYFYLNFLPALELISECIA